MELLIGTKLKQLRWERNLTQEEVAIHLGISFQAISKWERGDGYPDITILPALAKYFHISIDELLGINETAAQEEYTRINRQWKYNNTTGKHQENVDLMRSALKFFPNNALLLVQLSTSLEKLDGSDIQKQEYLKESIAVLEQIIRYGEDSEVRGATLYNICFAYDKIGERQKAIDQAKKLPNLYKGRENALVHFLDGEEKRQIAREALPALAWSLALHLTTLAEAENKPAYRDKISQILDILFEGNEDPFIQNIRRQAVD